MYQSSKQTISSLAGPGPECGRIKTQAIYSLTGLWRRPRHEVYGLTFDVRPLGARAPPRSIWFGNLCASSRGKGPVKEYMVCPLICPPLEAPGGGVSEIKPYSLTGPWTREGGVSKVKLWIKATPKPHGPVYKFEMRPRILMDPYIS